MHSSYQPLRPSLATTILHVNSQYAHHCFFYKETPGNEAEICMSCHNRGHTKIWSWQTLIVLHLKLLSVCHSKYQDHSKPLKHLPINIWFVQPLVYIAPTHICMQNTLEYERGGAFVINFQNARSNCTPLRSIVVPYLRGIKFKLTKCIRNTRRRSQVIFVEFSLELLRVL